MMNARNILKTLLIAGFIYFTAVAIVHFFGIKIPMLYIYYDFPSNAYQDRIISVLCFVFAMFLYTGYKSITSNLEVVKYIVLAGIVAIIGLLINNYISDEELKTNTIYWLEIMMLGLYQILLTIFYYILPKKTASKNE